MSKFCVWNGEHIIWKYLQVKEHLEIFATIKGVDEDSIDSSVTEVVDEVSSQLLYSADASLLI